LLLVFLHTFRSTLIVLLAISDQPDLDLRVNEHSGHSAQRHEPDGPGAPVGILVDDSIVVLENIGSSPPSLWRDPEQAQSTAGPEMAWPRSPSLWSMSWCYAGGVHERFHGAIFRDFGLVIASATLFSLLVSFTLTPLLASRVVPQRTGRRRQATPKARVTPWQGSLASGTQGYRAERGYAWSWADLAQALGGRRHGARFVRGWLRCDVGSCRQKACLGTTPDS